MESHRTKGNEGWVVFATSPRKGRYPPDVPEAVKKYFLSCDQIERWNHIISHLKSSYKLRCQTTVCVKRDRKLLGTALFEKILRCQVDDSLTTDFAT